MASSLAQGPGLHFELEGPFYRFMQRIGLVRGTDSSVGRRIVAFLLITWVPLLAFSFFEGRALGPMPRESLLLDFAAHARFFMAAPLKLPAGALL